MAPTADKDSMPVNATDRLPHLTRRGLLRRLGHSAAGLVPALAVPPPPAATVVAAPERPRAAATTVAAPMSIFGESTT